jgi:hypothetical protein
MAKLSLLLFLVLIQFTLLPFITMVAHNKPVQFKMYGHTVIYKSN